ncbi:MAG: hypothetical protein CVT48_05195 [Thermoplasmata archaeon HGW-Thermoplasmata-1]|nr:MAG: hypothetical protein CVT48_05195 [Thermoplasmata archaeon HGW-Thermoplasmata-1]
MDEVLLFEVATLLAESGLRITTAESCTGGLLAHTLTNVPGSSAYFETGFVTYGNEAKRRFLGVSRQTLRRCGAVSVETAREMAFGARKKSGADIALATTGIAGPTDGNEAGCDMAKNGCEAEQAMTGKPVGLVYVALSSKEGTVVEKRRWDGDDRLRNKERTVEAALTLLKSYLYGRGQ